MTGWNTVQFVFTVGVLTPRPMHCAHCNTCDEMCVRVENPKSIKQESTCTRAYNTESSIVLRKTVLPTPPHSIRSFHTGRHACTAAEDVQNRQWPKKVAEVGQVLLRAALLVRQAQHLRTSWVKFNCSALYIHHGLKKR